MTKLLWNTIGICCFVGATSANAAYYPSEFYYSEAGFNQSKPLQEKLNTTQGEFFFRKTGLYVGATDSTSYSKNQYDEENYELDAYAGIKQNYGDFGYHFGFKSYNRSTEKDIDVQEMYVGGNYRNFGLSYASNDRGEYTQINYKYKLSIATLGFHVGKTKPVVGEEFSDWSIHASKMYRSLRFNAIMTKSADPLNNDTQFNFGIERSLSLF